MIGFSLLLLLGLIYLCGYQKINLWLKQKFAGAPEAEPYDAVPHRAPTAQEEISALEIEKHRLRSDSSVGAIHRRDQIEARLKELRSS